MSEAAPLHIPTTSRTAPPVPSSALTRGPYFAALPKRQCELSFYVEANEGDRKEGILFEGVEAYKCTYMTALSVQMIGTAYDKLVRLEVSPWLTEVIALSASHYLAREGSPRALQHLMMCFDDGPCYEIICTNYKLL